MEIEWLVKRVRARGGCVGVVGPGRANCRLDSQIASTKIKRMKEETL